MTKEQIVEQIENSFNDHKGINEAIDDAAFYIAAKFKQKYATQSHTADVTDEEIDDSVERELSYVHEAVRSHDFDLGFRTGYLSRMMDGWVKCSEDRKVDYGGFAAMLIEKDGIETTKIELIYNSIPYFYCTYWIPISLPKSPTT